MALTVKSFKELWQKEIMPEFKKDIICELKREIGKEIQLFAERFEAKLHEVRNQLKDIESSQRFISEKYDNVLEMIQTTNKELKATQNRLKESEEKVYNIEADVYNNMASVDEMQQYQRRDCLEITGIPVVLLDDPYSLVGEVCNVLNVDLDEGDISIAHRLVRTTKSTKDRIIVKFVKRSKRDEIYKQRRKLNGKTTRCLSTVNAEIEEGTISAATKIYINESLTAYRRRLFGKINAFKNANNYKFIWTTNGTIHLRQAESSPILHFTTMEHFQQFLDQQ